MAKSKRKKLPDNTVALNRKARFEYALEESLVAGLVLLGWEVKSLRAGRVQLQDSYILLKDNEAWLLGCLITPLNTASTHVDAEPTRTRKLLLTRKQIDKLIGAVQRKGYTVVPMKLFWKKNRIKLEMALAKGKKQHDKRATLKERTIKREIARGEA